MSNQLEMRAVYTETLLTWGGQMKTSCYWKLT